MTDHADDEAAIRRIIADVETGFNTNDAELCVAHFTSDATAVTVAGAQSTGRDALLDAHRAAFAGPLRDQYARYELTDVVFLRPDVALAHKRARATTAEGELIDGGQAMVALYVFVRDDGRWRIASRQNTLLAA